MFGHNDHHDENKLPAPDGALGDHSTPQPTDDTAGAYMDDVTPETTTPAPVDNTGLGNDDAAVAPTDPAATAPVAPAADVPATDGAAAPTAPAAPDPAAGPTPDADKLLDIKQQALQQLTPLVGHLEQSPEEKFRTTMMMIQASDNHELVPAAYEAAQQIPDEKTRAQALLDIVNEINYFTHGNEA
jgi:hypothetical protein